MKQVKLHSKKYPGISMTLPERPTPPGGEGSFEFAVGIGYLLPDASVQAVREQLASFPAHVKRNFRLEVQAIESDATIPEAAIANPIRATEEPVPADDDDSAVAEPKTAADLTDDDRDLIQVEVEKLYEKTIPEGQPLIEATAGNEELPIVLRKVYLQAVIDDEKLQKGLKSTAQDWLEMLNS